MKNWQNLNQVEEMNNKELLPCPFTGEKPDFIIYPIECGYKYEGKISVDSINLEIYFDGKDKEEVKEKLFNIWNNRAYPKEIDTYILHPVTGERMDKSMCKRVITQMYDEKRATKVKRHSTKHAIYEHCGSCNAPLSSTYSFCPNCGKKIDWSDYE